MKIHVRAFYVLFTTFLLACGSGTSSYRPEGKPIGQYRLTTLATPQPADIYNLAYQKQVQNELEELKSNQGPSDPLLVMDPYGTNALSIYVYFTSANMTYARYTVSASPDEIPTSDFVRWAPQIESSHSHEFTIIGLIPGVSNRIQIDLFVDSGENVFSGSFHVVTPEIEIRKTAAQFPKRFRTEIHGTPTDGLFITSCPIVTGGFAPNSSFLIDNEGVIRGQFRINSYANPRVALDGSTMIYAYSLSGIATVNKLGRVEKLYNIAPYHLHHDFVLDGNDLFILVDGEGQQEDLVYHIDTESGNSSRLLNLRDLFPGYNFQSNGGDWMHSNSISASAEPDGTKSLLISSRELSAIIKINDIFHKFRAPYIRYIISDNPAIAQFGTIFERSDALAGNVLIPNLGQHSVTYAGPEDPSNPVSGRYLIHFFNNNTTQNNSGIDWKGILPLEVWSQTGHDSTVGPRSMFDEYLIDENHATCQRRSSINLPYSGIMGSSQLYKQNRIACSATQFKIFEFDDSGKLLLGIHFDDDVTSNQPMLYRAFKFPF